MAPTIRHIDGSAELDRVRALCWAYRDFLLDCSPKERLVVQAFYPDERYRDLMDRLDQIHARPKGAILGAFLDGQMVGCGMTHQIAPDVAEIKRVFVTQAARGHGTGRMLTRALINQCRNDGYGTVMLDTSVSLTQAQALYLSLGFVERGAYHTVPPIAEGIIKFYEMTL